MKQYITKEQWNEITEEQRIEIVKKLNLECVATAEVFYLYTRLTIGRMIEFLGYAWWEKLFKIEHLTHKDYIDTKYGKQELCDRLWEKVKYKLK